MVDEFLSPSLPTRRRTSLKEPFLSECINLLSRASYRRKRSESDSFPEQKRSDVCSEWRRARRHFQIGFFLPHALTNFLRCVRKKAWAPFVRSFNFCQSQQQPLRRLPNSSRGVLMTTSGFSITQLREGLTAERKRVLVSGLSLIFAVKGNRFAGRSNT